jgi:hypothetical protein
MDRSIVFKSGGSIRDPADSWLEPGRIEKKIGEEKTWCDPAIQLTRQNLVKTRLQPVNFCFFIKTTSF